MHRIVAMPWLPVGGLVALLLGGLPAVSPAQTCSPESRPLVVLINSTTRLQLSSRKPIKTVVNPKDKLLKLTSVERDPTTVLLTGIEPGVTRIELEDNDGNRESRAVVVQADVEYLTAQLRRAVPLADVDIIPNGTNSVILTGYANRAEDITVLQAVAQNVGFTVINGVRLNGVQQVQLDVVIARVNRTKGRNFGFNFLGKANQTFFGSTVGNVVGGVQGTPVAATLASATPNNANLFGGVIGNRSGFLGFLEALETEGLAKLLAQPRLVTKSGQPASFLDGGEQAVPVPAGLGQVGVQFEEFGTRLNFLPIVLGNGRIHLEVEPEVSSLNAGNGVVIANTTVPGRVTQRVHTTVEMEAGQTFVIGGLIQKADNASATKVPVIGQIPFLGVFFSTKAATTDETELVIMVTPHLVDAQSACQVSKVLPGQESRTPDDFELFLEGILEAPRGQRQVFHGNRYVPAHLNGPAANLFPCGGQDDGLQSHRGVHGRGGHGCVPGTGCATDTCPTAPNAWAPGTKPAAPTGPVPAEGTAAPTRLPPAELGSMPPSSPEGDDLSAETPTRGARKPGPGIRLADPLRPPEATPATPANPPGGSEESGDW